MNDDEKRARLILALDYNISPRNFIVLIEKYKSAKNILDDKKIFNKIKKFLSKKGSLSENVNLEQVLVLGEPKYPQLLLNIYDPPICLFFKGNIDCIDFDKCISVVGTRKMSKYGISTTKRLIKFLVEHGYTIVSGLAYGIDAIAHEETLANNGQTIAVLGTAINHPYPQANSWLYKKIIENNGLVLSESIVDFEYGSWIFPKRNRIIAGLSKKLIVVEAPLKSGALITADLSFGYEREVYGIPGDIFSPNSLGVHKIIKENGAKILDRFDDLIEKEDLEVFSERAINNLKQDEINVINSIKKGYVSVELLVENLGYDINKLLNILGTLEIDDLIERYEDGSYMLK